MVLTARGDGQPAVVYVAAAILVGLLVSLEVARRSSIPLKNDVPVASAADLRERPSRFYRVRWEGVSVPEQWVSGGQAQVLLTFRNAGELTWPDAQAGDPLRRGGGGAVRVSYRWWAEERTVSEYDSRVSLPWPLRPSDALTLPLTVQVPLAPGRYRLQIDLVHELVTWFENQGAEPLMIPAIVQPRG